MMFRGKNVRFRECTLKVLIGSSRLMAFRGAFFTQAEGLPLPVPRRKEVQKAGTELKMHHTIGQHQFHHF